MKKIFPTLSILIFFLIVLAGCGPSNVVVRTRPVPPVYVRPAAPYPNYVWVEGEWIRSRNGYIYRKGYWAAPRARYHQYRGGHWEKRRHGWYWVSGRWN